MEEQIEQCYAERFNELSFLRYEGRVQRREYCDNNNRTK